MPAYRMQPLSFQVRPGQAECQEQGQSNQGILPMVREFTWRGSTLSGHIMSALPVQEIQGGASCQDTRIFSQKAIYEAITDLDDGGQAYGGPQVMIGDFNHHNRRLARRGVEPVKRWSRPSSGITGQGTANWRDRQCTSGPLPKTPAVISGFLKHSLRT